MKSIKRVFFVLIFLGISLMSFSQSENIALKKEGEWGSGAYLKMIASGQYVYCASYTGGIDIIDIEDKDNPVKVGNFEILNIKDFCISGDFAYVASRSDIIILDISDGIHPVQVGRYTYGGDVVAVKGNYLYTVHSYGHLEVIDISNKKNPSIVGFYEDIGGDYYYFTRFEIYGDYAFVAERYPFEGSYIKIFNISNPNNPVFVQSLSTQVRNFVISGHYLYLSTMDQGIKVMDLTDPYNPVLTGPGYTSMKTWNIEALGSYIFVQGENSKISILDFSDPLNPTKKSDTGVYVPTGRFTVSYNTLYSFSGTGLNVTDVSSPSSPEIKSSYEGSGNASRIAVSDNYVYLVDKNKGLKIIDITDNANPKQVGMYASAGYSSSTVAVYGNYACFLDDKGLHVLDISNKTTPNRVGYYKMTDVLETDKVYFNGNWGVVTNGLNFLIMDFTNKAKPQKVGNYSNSAEIRSMACLGNYIYAVFGSGYMEVIDITDKTAPTRVGRISIPLYDYSDIAVSGSIACIVSASGDTPGLITVDISNSKKPTIKGQYRVFPLNHVTISGNYAYVGGTFNWDLHVFDISNPAVPNLSASWNTLGTVQGLGVLDNYIYLTNGDSGKINIIKAAPNKTASITVISPNGGETWWPKYFGKNTIAWTAKDLSGNVSIDLYKGDQYLYHIGDASVKSGFYTWEFPSIFTEGNGYKIHISQPYKSDFSDETFSMVDDHYSHLSIDKEELYFSALPGSNPSNQTFTVSGIGSSGITLQANKPWIKFGISANRSTTQNYTVSIDTTGLDMSAGRYTGNISVTSIDATNSPQTIRVVLDIVSSIQPSIKLINPNGKEVWETSKKYYINWGASGITGEVSVDLYKGLALYMNLGKANATTGVLSWAIPDTFPRGRDYRIRISQGDLYAISDNYFSILSSSSKSIILSNDNLFFNAISTFVTPVQEITISNGGEGILNWIAIANEEWISVTPASGTGSGAISVTINPQGLSKGYHLGKITVLDYDAENSPCDITVSLNISTSSSKPFGEFSTPLNNSTLFGSIPVTGWALDDIGIKWVKIYRAPVSGEGNANIYIGDAVFVNGARPDIEQAYPEYPAVEKAGWGYMLLTHFLPGKGNGTYTLYAIASDEEGNEITLGSKTINCDNAGSSIPFGAIDSPAQGETVGGDLFINYGWALTPVPNMIPFDGSTITVWIDGMPVGHPTYDQYREDIAEFFPGYENSNGAVGFYIIDTTKYDNGTHMISWSVKDSGGNEGGIGSRYFTIRNSGEYRKASVPAKLITNSTTSHSTSTLKSQVLGKRDSIGIIKGYDPSAQWTEINGDDNKFYVEIKELERFQMQLEQGVTNVTPLPVGATLDSENGVFYWNPGPGFVGEYRLKFTSGKAAKGKTVTEVVVFITPKN